MYARNFGGQADSFRPAQREAGRAPQTRRSV